MESIPNTVFELFGIILDYYFTIDIKYFRMLYLEHFYK